MPTPEEVDLVFDMREALVRAIRVPTDPKAATSQKVNPEYARRIAEYLLTEGLIDLDALEESALMERREADEEGDD